MWSGISYPIKATEQGIYQIAENEKLLEGNIKQILGTRRGERVMLPRFGTRLLEYIHDPIDDTTAQFLRVEITDALKEWEPRIIVSRVEITQRPEEYLVRVRVVYRTELGSDEKTCDLAISTKGGDVTWG